MIVKTMATKVKIIVTPVVITQEIVFDVKFATAVTKKGTVMVQCSLCNTQIPKAHNCFDHNSGKECLRYDDYYGGKCDECDSKCYKECVGCHKVICHKHGYLGELSREMTLLTKPIPTQEDHNNYIIECSTGYRDDWYTFCIECLMKHNDRQGTSSFHISDRIKHCEGVSIPGILQYIQLINESKAKQIASLEAKVEQLQRMLDFQPGGPGALAAESSFNELKSRG